MKNLMLGFMLYMFLGNCGFAQTVWVPVYQPQLVPVVVQKEVVPVYVVQQPQYVWAPCWRRWWVFNPYYYQWVYVGGY